MNLVSRDNNWLNSIAFSMAMSDKSIPVTFAPTLTNDGESCPK